MKKTISLILILVIILFSLTGCYSNIDIDKYFYIIALGIDSSDNDLLKVSVQIASSTSSNSSSSGSGSSQSANFNIYTVEATTLDSAITLLNNYLNKKINLSHCSALVISEELAKRGIKEYFSTLSNSTELRHSCELLISSTTALDVLENVAHTGEVFSSRLYDYLTTSTEYTAFTVDSTFGKFFSSLQNPNKDSVAIYSKIIDKTVQSAGTAVFDGDIMLGSLTVLQTISHLLTTNELETCNLKIENPSKSDSYVDLKLKLYKNTEIDIDMINGAPFITVSIYPEGIISGSGEDYNYTNDNHIKKVEQATNAYISEIVNDYLYTISKKFSCDIVGFGGIYAAKIPTQDEFNDIHWEEIFKDSFFKVNVDTKINSSNLFNKQQ